MKMFQLLLNCKSFAHEPLTVCKHFRTVVLNRGRRPPPRGGQDFQGGARPDMLHNMGRFRTGMCPFQTLHQR